jgi:hypothetical protein
MTTTLSASVDFMATEPLASESTVETIFLATSDSLILWLIPQDRAEVEIRATLARDSRPPGEAPTARQRWLHMAERARQRMASAPTYPDSPDDIAEQEATTRALAESQARSQSES